MPHIKDEIQGRKVVGKWDIRLKRYYIDSFGKEYIDYKDWDSFATEEIWKREEEVQKKMMVNCGYKV